MLYLIFELGKDRYALQAGQVVEVLPLLDFKRVPRAMPGVAGLFNYHGTATPLLDLTELNLGRPSQAKMSTRIIVTNYVNDSGERHRIGLLAERVTETIRRAEADFKHSGVGVEGARFLGPVLVEANHIIQRVEIHHLLPENVGNQLFAELVG
ncbi:MAG TPA: chemotaxis protein CheW [Candidatus Acidoferrales bacterium]|jgi:chemotaxis-related protein WspB|nr:chemotaxis protein CheW [Candidatus Acidoferrales bacterium]